MEAQSPNSGKILFLPAEITDAIVDHLYDDRQTLQVCAMVCRVWLHPSRNHLFREFTIAHRRSAAYCSTLNFLATTPKVATYIRSLKLAHHHISSSDLNILFAALPKLRSLTLSDLDVGVDPDTAGDPPRFRGLHELKITSCNINYEFPLLFRFLGLFEFIYRLELHVEIRVLNMDSSTQDLPPPQLALTHLVAFHIPLAIVSKLIQNTRTRETLQCLWYDDTLVDWPDVEELGDIVKIIGPSRSFKRIVFGPLNIFTPYWDNFPPDQNAEDIGRWPALNLECCKGLEVFSLRTRMLLRVHVDIFAHLPPNVNTIWITLIGIDRSVSDPGEDSQWADFNAAFSVREFQHLKLVLDTSRVKLTTSDEQYAQLVERATMGLPTLRAQNRLAFSEVERPWWACYLGPGSGSG